MVASFVVLCICLLIYLIFCFCKGIKFKRSLIYEGEVIESERTEIVHFLRDYSKIYETYDVKINYKGVLCRTTIRSSLTGLKPGNKIPIYIYEKHDSFEIQESDIYWRKFESISIIFIIIIFVMLLGLASIYSEDTKQNYESNKHLNLQYEHNGNFTYLKITRP